MMVTIFFSTGQTFPHCNALIAGHLGLQSSAFHGVIPGRQDVRILVTNHGGLMACRYFDRNLNKLVHVEQGKRFTFYEIDGVYKIRLNNPTVDDRVKIGLSEENVV